MATLTGGNLDETLIGGLAVDLISGLGGNDSLVGNESDDTLNGGKGDDTLEGGVGNDTYVVDSAADVIVESGKDFQDRIQASISIDLKNYTGIEHVTLLGKAATSAVGNAGANMLVGNTGANTLDGGAGSDTLDGGAGTDSLIGGSDSDTYIVSSAADKIDESGGGADDRILGSIAIDLNKYSGIEHAALGGAGALSAIGDAGANMLMGNAGDNKLDGSAGLDTLIGGAGNDIYLVGDLKDVAIENPGEGIDTVISTVPDFSSIYALDANIENLILGPGALHGKGNAIANVITGNGANNELSGLEGNDSLIGNDGGDILDGNAGADSMVGGKGSDVYRVDDAGDKVVESGPAGDSDSVTVALAAYTLGANLEGLSHSGNGDFTGTGNSLNNTILGFLGNDVLNGLAGKDILYGGDGDDTLIGGAGSDRFGFSNFVFVSAGVDVIADFNGLPGGDQLDFDILGFLAAGTEADFIQTEVKNGSTIVRIDNDGTGGGSGFVDVAVLQGVSTDLAGLLANGSIADVEAEPTPAIDGAAGADNKVGTGISDLIRGLGGNDTLTGGAGFNTLDGGVGADSMIGGTDSDTYIVNSAADKIDESGGGTDDRILASMAIDLNNAAYTGVEHATLTGTAALSAIGNAGANMLIGNSAANKLDGRAGLDTLIGGAGNDIYLVDDISDVVIENSGDGVDTVIVTATIDFKLGANIENLTVASNVASGYEVAGNALANKIIGGAGGFLSGEGGNDLLIGGNGNDGFVGGAGADTMVGGKGQDTYFVDDLGDKVVETGPAGQDDQIFSTVSYVLGANLEHLNLFEEASKEKNIDGTGNTLNNFLGGNTGNNILSGLAGNDTLAAGQGTDTLVGGAGSDEFRLTDKNLDGLDTIADFDGLPGGDKLSVSQVVGVLAAGTEANFIQTVVVNGSTIIQLALDGSGAGPDAVVLQGVSTDLAGLLANGSILDVGTLATAPIDGTAGADNKIGTGVSNLIHGLGANDTLTGGGGFDTLDGGAGNDSLIGGSESDTYVVNSAGDKIDESGGGTDDRILASIAIDLNNAAYAGIEHVTLTGVMALSAIGNADGNMLIGNIAANKLDGGAGVDTLIGGAGNDIYLVDDVDDLAIENPGQGIDTVISTVGDEVVGYTLGAGVENLILATGTIKGTGNDLANNITGDGDTSFLNGEGGNDTLIGNGGNDELDGGAGADSMVGGKGADTYFVDDVGDKVVENGGAADNGDMVNSIISYTLGANLEGITLSGKGEIDGTGNGLNNQMFGNDANNTLRGLVGNDVIDAGGGNDILLGGDGNDLLDGDKGADTLVGGGGKDTFRLFDGDLTGTDVIADFNGLPGGDVIDVGVLLLGFTPGISDVNDFLKASIANGSTTLQVDLDGAIGGANFVDMAVLQGVSTSIDGLLANGSLLLVS
ncbi:MAG TPA: calcium-binding protein [Verrucomicrobiae bacterium]|nr:calcium-binding protein [Verrucomicrobiae bacterium]